MAQILGVSDMPKDLKGRCMAFSALLWPFLKTDFVSINPARAGSSRNGRGEPRSGEGGRADLDLSGLVLPGPERERRPGSRSDPRVLMSRAAANRDRDMILRFVLATVGNPKSARNLILILSLGRASRAAARTAGT